MPGDVNTEAWPFSQHQVMGVDVGGSRIGGSASAGCGSRCGGYGNWRFRVTPGGPKMPGKPDQHDEDGEGGDGKRETGTHRRTTLEQRGFRDYQVQSVKVLLQRRTRDMRI